MRLSFAFGLAAFAVGRNLGASFFGQGGESQSLKVVGEADLFDSFYSAPSWICLGAYA